MPVSQTLYIGAESCKPRFTKSQVWMKSQPACSAPSTLSMNRGSLTTCGTTLGESNHNQWNQKPLPSLNTPLWSFLLVCSVFKGQDARNNVQTTLFTFWLSVPDNLRPLCIGCSDCVGPTSFECWHDVKHKYQTYTGIERSFKGLTSHCGDPPGELKGPVACWLGYHINHVQFSDKMGYENLWSVFVRGVWCCRWWDAWLKAKCILEQAAVLRSKELNTRTNGIWKSQFPFLTLLSNLATTKQNPPSKESRMKHFSIVVVLAVLLVAAPVESANRGIERTWVPLPSRNI